MATDVSSDNPPSSQPLVGRVRWIALFIAAYIIIQLALPLRYYLASSSPLAITSPDERFAWRMFSYQGMHKCTVSAWEVVEREGKRTIERLELNAITHAYRLERNRPEVVTKFMRWRCEQPGVVQVRFMVRCTSPGGETIKPQHYWMDRSDLVLHDGEPE